MFNYQRLLQPRILLSSACILIFRSTGKTYKLLHVIVARGEWLHYIRTFYCCQCTRFVNMAEAILSAGPIVENATLSNVGGVETAWTYMTDNYTRFQIVTYITALVHFVSLINSVFEYQIHVNLCTAYRPYTQAPRLVHTHSSQTQTDYIDTLYIIK